MANRKDDAAVEAAYLRRIQGYEVTEEKHEYKVAEDGALELTRLTTATKHVPGDPRAAEFWLTNRRPKRWKKSPGERAEEPAQGGVVVLPEVEAQAPGEEAGHG